MRLGDPGHYLVVAYLMNTQDDYCRAIRGRSG
jgi:hypothetical protein